MCCGLVFCLCGTAGSGGPQAGLACRLCWQLSVSWAWQVGSLAGLGKWLVDGPAPCHAAALPVGRQWGWAGAGGQWAGLLWASCAGGCWPVRAGLGKLVGQLGWTGGWLGPHGGRLSPALFCGLSYWVEAGVEHPG